VLAGIVSFNDGIFVDLSKPIIWKDEKDED